MNIEKNSNAISDLGTGYDSAMVEAFLPKPRMVSTTAYFRPEGSEELVPLGDVEDYSITPSWGQAAIETSERVGDYLEAETVSAEIFGDYESFLAALAEVSVAGDEDGNAWVRPSEENRLAVIEGVKAAQAVYSQARIKRTDRFFRRTNLELKRANTNKMLGIDLVAQNAHEHGSRAIRRKVFHDARKGTKPAPFGGGSVKMTDVDIVERHGRPALGVMSAERFQSALSALWETGRRLDLKPKTEFQRTVDALADVMGRRVSV